MDPTLVYWKSHGQSFFSRVKIWFDLLDPTALISSDNEIRKAHSLLNDNEKQSEKNGLAPSIIALTSIQADTGEVLPLIFRPPALFLLSSPMVYAAFMPHTTVKAALLCHFLMQSYYTGFNYEHRNVSAKKERDISIKHTLLNMGTVSYATVAGAIPQIIINQLQLSTPSVVNLCRTALPVPLAAFLAYFNLVTIRNEESENGIQVFDSEGNAVGLSRAAADKAVRETALSRATLLGTTAAVPNLLLSLLHRSRFFQKRSPPSPLLGLLRPFSMVFVLGLMIPVSFSLFPQLGTIEKAKLEEKLQAAAVDGHLFYHRGL